MLYNLNLCGAVCQLYINKTGKNITKILLQNLKITHLLKPLQKEPRLWLCHNKTHSNTGLHQKAVITMRSFGTSTCPSSKEKQLSKDKLGEHCKPTANN